MIGPLEKSLSVDEQMARLPAAVKPILEAARLAVLSAAPRSEEIAYQSSQPRSHSTMWKIARYAAGGANVVGIGTFTEHSALYFYRGRELDDGTGLLQGGGKEMRFIRLHSPADAEQPAVKRLIRRAFELGG